MLMVASGIRTRNKRERGVYCARTMGDYHAHTTTTLHARNTPIQFSMQSSFSYRSQKTPKSKPVCYAVSMKHSRGLLGDKAHQRGGVKQKQNCRRSTSTSALGTERNPTERTLPLSSPQRRYRYSYLNLTTPTMVPTGTTPRQ